MTLFGVSQIHEILPRKQKLEFSFKRINLDTDELATFSNLRESYEYSSILESAVGPERLAELSIIVFDPFCILTADGEKIKVEDRRSSNVLLLDAKNGAADPLLLVRKIVNSMQAEQAEFRFAGGAVGYVGYDAIRYWEKKLAAGKKPRPKFPEMQFCFYEEGILFDHQKRSTYYFFSNRVKKDRQSEIRELLERMRSTKRASPDLGAALSCSERRTNVKQEKFESWVRSAKESIRNGDIFQVVLSKRFKFNFRGDLLRFYSELRRVNPSPYMYYLDLGETKIVGSSPEMLVRVERRMIETFPIAGTREVTANSAQNERLRKELLADPKERAEHTMLVDLARNDVGRVSEFGSVSVPEFMEVRRFSHVQHIVSQVTGKLREGLDSFDALRSIFPAGTVSGAPKIRAMEIIDELETEGRGPYAGAVGYFSFNGNMDSAITIRTLVARGNEASIQAGAGIVADSNPRREWFETEHKARALFNALELSVERAS